MRGRRRRRWQGPWAVLPQPGGGQGLAGVQGRARARRSRRACGRPTPPRAGSRHQARGCPADRVHVRARALAVAGLAAAGRGHPHGRQPRCRQEHARRRPRRPHHDRARWPDGSPGADPPGRAMWITTEEDPGRVLRPRIEAAGGDASLVRFVKSEVVFPSGAARSPSSSCAGGESEGLGLVILDPLFSHIEATVRTIADAEMRKGVMNLSARPPRPPTSAILVVRHFSKDVTASAINRGAGSLGGIVGAARALWSRGGPRGRDGRDEGRRRVQAELRRAREALPTRGRPHPPGLGRRIRVRASNGWGEAATRSRRCSARGPVAEAARALEEILAAGPLPAAARRTGCGPGLRRRGDPGARAASGRGPQDLDDRRLDLGAARQRRRCPGTPKMPTALLTPSKSRRRRPDTFGVFGASRGRGAPAGRALHFGTFDSSNGRRRRRSRRRRRFPRARARAGSGPALGVVRGDDRHIDCFYSAATPTPRIPRR